MHEDRSVAGEHTVRVDVGDGEVEHVPVAIESA